MASHSLIIEAYLNALRDQEASTLPGEELESEFIAPLKNTLKKQDKFLVRLNYYLDILDNTNEVLIEYMSEENKEIHRRHLQIAYLLVLTQKQHEFELNLFENRTLYNDYLAKCENLLDKLNPYKQAQSEAQANLSPEQPIKYTGLALGYELSEEVLECAGQHTQKFRARLDSLNQKRLYWVWASSLIKLMLDLTPPDFFNSANAAKIMRSPDYYTGALSWILYYFRLSISFGLVLKHTIPGFWMSEEEKQTPWQERLLAQLDQRKFTMIELDAFWATANLVCFYVLTAQKGLGPWGDLLTMALLY